MLQMKGKSSGMPERILLVDLTSSEYDYIPYAEKEVFGRGLVLDLFEKYLPDETGRYDPDNLIVIVPGLFSGTPAPSACRMFVATIEAGDRGVQISNTSGNMPQKLGSLGIAGLVIRGKAPSRGTVLHISRNGVRITADDSLNGISCGKVIEKLKDRYSRDSAVIGCGIAGDMMLSLSTYFCTFPDGTPEYHCSRDGFGDVWGAKNLRAVVVEEDSYFAREVKDPERFSSLAKKLARLIINDEVCGKALPSYGSMTIMKILEDPDRPVSGLVLQKHKPDSSSGKDKSKQDVRVNRNCAPMCVIGCLNRHAEGTGIQYSTPSQAETQGMISKCFGVDDPGLAKDVQDIASEIGIVATEFVSACKTYAESLRIEHGEEHLIEWLREVEKGSTEGRVIASRTYGLAKLYADEDLSGWIDRKAIQDEKLFDIRLNTKYPQFSGLSELDLLYSQVFVLENLGFCIFTAFALLDRTETFELMAEMVEAMLGTKLDGADLIANANKCLNNEREYNMHRWMTAQKTSIPPFTKVLYRYFGSKAGTKPEGTGDATFGSRNES